MREFLLQVLWLAVLVVPIPAGAFAVHTPDAMLVAFLSYTALATLVPFFYFQVQKSGYGIGEGKRRSAVHLVNALGLLGCFWMAVWFGIAGEERLWQLLGAAAGTALAAAVLVLLLALLLWSDIALLRLYDRISGRREWTARWLGLSFFIGWIPGWLLAALFFFSFTGLDGGMVFFFYMTTGMTWILYMKLFLAMMGICFYLYFGETGSRWRRALQVVFTAIFWLMLVYIPLLASLYLPSAGAWRAYADPSYLSICPFLSDLWLTGAAYAAGRKLTAWIYAAGERP